jgi:ABC-type branched-subunit amino acid transport system substrate-binding protein
LVGTLNHKLQVLMVLTVLLCLTGCSQIVTGKSPVGILSSNPPEKTALLVVPVADEQQAGYKLGIQEGAGGYKLVQANEGNLKDDVQIAVRAMVEDEKVVALIGATSNEATMHASSLVNFFNVPMIVPSANGDNLLPSNNLWVFRLSAPSSAYANYLFGTIVLQPATAAGQGTTATSLQVQGPKLAIIYEQNTFGESAAVATAHAAMAVSTEITLYESFQPGALDAERLNVLAQDIKASKANLVYLISNNPSEAKSLVSGIFLQFDVGKAPILVGQDGGFVSRDFLDASEAQGVYVIRQALDMKECPIVEESIIQAQSYAAVYLIEEAIKQSEASMLTKTFLSGVGKTHADLLITRREKVRDALKEMDVTVPCIGRVKFDNTGQNKFQQFSLLLINNGKIVAVSEDEFRIALDDVVARDTAGVEE